MTTNEAVIAEEAGVKLMAVEQESNVFNVVIRTATFEVRVHRRKQYRTIIAAGTDLSHAFALYREVLKATRYQPTLQQEVPA